jgi:PAS domain S-box-containing protein
LERINAALHQSQAQLAEAQSIAGVGSYELNVLTREISWSDETYRLWGRDPNLGPVGAEEAFAALHLEDRDRIRASFDRSIARGVPLDEQARLVWPDGSLHHFHLKARAERDEQGRVSRLVGTLQDITRRKRTEAALRYSEQSLAMIFNGVSDSIWLVSVEEGECYRFRSINDSFLRVTGFTREQVLHRRIEEWFPPESLELVKAKYREVVTTGLSLQYEETTELPAGRRVGEVTVIPIPDSAGRCSTRTGAHRHRGP